MIVGMRTCKRAAKVAELTGGARLAGKPKPDGTPTVSRYVDVGADFGAHRAAVESVSVLFELYDGDGDGYAATGSPGAKLPTGWTVSAAKFELDWPADPDRAALVRSHFGARRFAFNWGLARVTLVRPVVAASAPSGAREVAASTPTGAPDLETEAHPTAPGHIGQGGLGLPEIRRQKFGARFGRNWHETPVRVARRRYFRVLVALCRAAKWVLRRPGWEVRDGN